MNRKNLRKIPPFGDGADGPNLEKLAAMAGYGDQAGRVVDKLVRDGGIEVHRTDGKKDET